jgi:hypothetical protein
MTSMLFRNRLRQRKVLKLARVLLELDDSARAVRGEPRRKALRSSLSSAR